MTNSTILTKTTLFYCTVSLPNYCLPTPAMGLFAPPVNELKSEQQDSSNNGPQHMRGTLALIMMNLSLCALLSKHQLPKAAINLTPKGNCPPFIAAQLNKSTLFLHTCSYAHKMVHCIKYKVPSSVDAID